MMKGNLMVDENLSVLTCASAEITRNEITDPLYSHHSSASTNQPPPSKKKRNLPGNPDPEAEVIAMSPKALLATNRFICEICNKGFQRDQNLQLHRRGHNLPWKLKQRGSKEFVRKKVYVCPEPTCVHHHPSRALGDLTGIKKHFCRKHGEKKWKCEKCSKRYAVQSDWKAHSKICGTREYRCDCGTLFSRRDSFITHRAFCDALAQESTTVAVTSSPMNMNMNMNLNHNQTTTTRTLLSQFPIKTEDGRFYPLTNSLQLPSFQNGHHHPPPNLIPFQNPNPNFTPIGFGLMGHSPGPGQLFGSCTTTPAWELNNNNNTSPAETTPFLHHMMALEEASFEEALSGILMSNRANKDGHNGGGSETRDFLGLRAVARRPPHHMIFQNEILNDMSNLDSSSSSTFGLHQNHQSHTTFWRH